MCFFIIYEQSYVLYIQFQLQIGMHYIIKQSTYDMKTLIVLCLILFVTFSLPEHFNFKKSLKSINQKIDKIDFARIIDKFGDIRLHRQNQDTQQVVLQHIKDHYRDQQSIKAALDIVLDITQKQERKKEFLQCAKGPHAEFFKFGTVHVGFIGNKSTHESIVLQRRPDDCFQTVVVNFTNNKHNAINSVTVQIFASGKKHEGCTQTYVFSTASKLHVQTFRLKNHHKFVWKNMNQVDYNNVVTWGIHVFRLCDTLAHWFPDVLKTLQAFVGGVGTNPKIPFFGSKPTKSMERANVEFIEAGTGFRWKDRQPKFVNLSSYQVKSGDFLAVTRFDGIDQIIQYGAGSHSGHSCVILEVDGVMSVVESQDGWYWPKHGIQRNDWQTWKKWALNAGFNVAVLPLTQQSRSKFNVTKAAQFFKRMQGFPYGYHNFLFGWIDTPKDNYPPILDPNFVLAMFSYLERLYEYPINRILTQGLNKRLGVQNRKMSQLAVLMAKKNMTFGDLMAMPEKDGWWYNDGPSYVCSSFVIAVYKAGGLLNDLEGTQMTPKDVYTLNIYDINYKVPNKCKQNDPTLPYCQIMGNKLMELPQYATIQPYPRMCERCPTMTPDFFRPDGC